ncbi:hypothetical protein EKE94_05145 [Mesobaculum littorinae]|uniref:DUF3396 domain-containing protein n=1 Tax=Mesobaculum littorinae TaxID=2486419 RepID=A0A438AI94_9RHOB|nr:hypothetical protein [Mesobaculum littorinae]RVV98317.1 hypothetical protein EKE94_05145 [Mesobaculum littorinae]
MPEFLYRDTTQASDQKVGAPILRITALTDPLDGATLAGPGGELLDLFLTQFGADVAFVAKGPTTGRSRASRLTKATDKRIGELRAILRDGGVEKFGLRIYGPDDTGFGRPLAPYASIAHMIAETDAGVTPYAQIDFALPPEGEASQRFLHDSDEVLRRLPLRAGVQGLGFAGTPVEGSLMFLYPPAFRRYRAAVIADWRIPSALVFHNPNATQVHGDYTAGLPDIGWRTYVGPEFSERLQGRPRHPEVTVEQAGAATVVTAGAAPIWGDLNTGEDIGPFRAAARFLEPALASRGRRIREAPCYVNGNPEREALAADYLDRFKGSGA